MVHKDIGPAIGATPSRSRRFIVPAVRDSPEPLGGVWRLVSTGESVIEMELDTFAGLVLANELAQ